jgi:phage gpG-like protein
MALDWQGPAVTAKLRRAQIEGINATMAAAAIHAKRNHPWRNRTGTLEGSIDIAEYAREHGRGVRGVWGSRDVRYALIHELGGVITAKTAKALHFEIAGEHIVVKQVTIPARPYLRPAADAEYPKLAARIRRAFGAAR